MERAIPKSWRDPRLRGFLVPAGPLLLITVLVLQTGVLSPSASGVDFYYYAATLAGLLLAWRFRNARVLFTLFTIVLAHRAVAFFSPGHFTSSGPGHISYLAVSVLLPINFIMFAAVRERGLSLPSVAPRAGLLFCEAIFVAAICRPGAAPPAFLKMSLGLPFSGSRLPQLTIALLAGSAVFIAVKYLWSTRPSHAAQAWALVATWIALEQGYMTRVAQAYLATAAVILLAGIVEDSYLLAYHDELTGIPGRRAFNDATAQLDAPYVIAAVDIDHFKLFNDTYGHDTGDQVLRLVANRLARVTGDGRAFRVGGEEFAILFTGKRLRAVLPHLQALRVAVEQSSFRQRTGGERRALSRGPDRRNTGQRTGRTKQLKLFDESQLSVTVSIGAAESLRPGESVDSTMRAADKALYRAKKAGRNRVEAVGRASQAGSRAKRVTA